MTERIDALKALLANVEAGEFPADTSARDIGLAEISEQTGLPIIIKMYDAFSGSIDAAKELHEALLPGWGYRIGECHLTDDAAVFPDFNCPAHGDRLRRELDEYVDWFDLTDVAASPAGNPARAWLIAILKALIAQ